MAIGDNDVDIYDLTYFANEWLWQEESQMQMMMVSPQIYSGGSSGGSSALMLSSADSFSHRPARLIEKTQKFYALTPSDTISAKQKELASIKDAKSLASINAKQTQITMQSGLAVAVGATAETLVGDTAMSHL